MKLLVFFVIIPLIELYVLIQVGSEVGALSVVLWTVLGAILGVLLMRQQGLATMQNAQQAMSSGESMQETMMQDVFIFLGGLLLFLPGLISDAIGLILLIPFIRNAMIRKALQGFAQKAHFKSRYSQQNVYEGDFQEKAPESPKVLEGEVLKDSKER